MTKTPETILYEALEKTLENHASADVLEALRRHEDLDLKSLALTSLHYVEIELELEDSLGVELDEDEFDGLGKISDLVRLIESRL